MENFSVIIKDWCESDNRTVIENIEYIENLNNINNDENKNINLESFLPDFTNVVYDNNIKTNTITTNNSNNFNMLEYQLKSYCNIL